MLKTTEHYKYVGDFSEGIYQHSHIRTFIGSVHSGMRTSGMQSIAVLLKEFISSTENQVNVLIKFLNNLENQYGITAATFQIDPSSADGLLITELEEIKSKLGKDGIEGTKKIVSKGAGAVVENKIKTILAQGTYDAQPLGEAIANIMADEFGQAVTEETVREITKTFNTKLVKIKTKSNKNINIRNFGDLKNYSNLTKKKLLKGFSKFSRVREVESSYKRSIEELNTFCAKLKDLGKLSIRQNAATQAGIEKISNLFPKTFTFDGRKGLYTEISSAIGFLLEPLMVAALFDKRDAQSTDQIKINKNSIILSTQSEQSINTADIQVQLSNAEKDLIKIGASVKSNPNVFYKKQTINRNFLREYDSGISDVTINKLFYIILNYRSLKNWNVESINASRQFNADDRLKTRENDLNAFTGFYNEVNSSLTYLATIKSLLGIVFMGHNNLIEIENAMKQTDYVPLVLNAGTHSYLMSELLTKIKEVSKSTIGSFSSSGSAKSLIFNFMRAPAARWDRKISHITGGNTNLNSNGHLIAANPKSNEGEAIAENLKAENMISADKLEMDLVVRFNYGDLGL